MTAVHTAGISSAAQPKSHDHEKGAHSIAQLADTGVYMLAYLLEPCQQCWLLIMVLQVLPTLLADHTLA